MGGSRHQGSRWFAPTAEQYELDAHPGGTERLVADVDGTEMTFEATYLDVVEDRRLVFTSALRADGRLSTVAVDTVALDDDGRGGTALTLVQQATFLDGMEEPEWRRAGIRSQLDALLAVLVPSAVAGARPPGGQ